MNVELPNAWFYLHPTNGKPLGPLDKDQLIVQLNAFEDPRAVLVQQEGVLLWMPAAQVGAIREALPPEGPTDVLERVEQMAEAPEANNGLGVWLSLLCVDLSIIRPAVGILGLIGGLSLLSISGELPHRFVFWIGVDTAATALLTIWSLSAGLKLWRGKPEGVSQAKWFLWSNFAWQLLTAALGWLIELAYLIDLGITSAALTSAVLWTIYLSESQSVARIYGPASTANQTELL